MLEATSPQLLVIATPPSAHLGEMAAAAARDVHVLCEKPLGLSDDDVTALARAGDWPPPPCAGDGAPVPLLRRPWRWIVTGGGGALRTDEPFQLDVEVERPGTDPLSAGGWRADPEHEGGILGDHAVHYLALFHLLDPACEVVACHREGPGGREVASLRSGSGLPGWLASTCHTQGAGVATSCDWYARRSASRSNGVTQPLRRARQQAQRGAFGGIAERPRGGECSVLTDVRGTDRWPARPGLVRAGERAHDGCRRPSGHRHPVGALAYRDEIVADFQRRLHVCCVPSVSWTNSATSRVPCCWRSLTSASTFPATASG